LADKPVEENDVRSNESSETPKNILAEIQKRLHHAESKERLGSIEKLSTLSYRSEGVLR
jgi:hypothetical protein